MSYYLGEELEWFNSSLCALVLSGFIGTMLEVYWILMNNYSIYYIPLLKFIAPQNQELGGIIILLWIGGNKNRWQLFWTVLYQEWISFINILFSLWWDFISLIISSNSLVVNTSRWTMCNLATVIVNTYSYTLRDRSRNRHIHREIDKLTRIHQNRHERIVLTHTFISRPVFDPLLIFLIICLLSLLFIYIVLFTYYKEMDRHRDKQTQRQTDRLTRI